MKQTFLTNSLMGIICIPLISGCIDNQRDLFQEPEKISKEQFFDFNMNQSIAVDVDYGFKEDYVVLFEIYDRNPFEADEDGSLKKKEVEPLFRAATDKQGKFSGDGVTIPADISEVWLSSDYLGTASPVKLTIGADRRISFNQDAYIKSLLAAASTATRGAVTTINQHQYQDTDWALLLPDMDWDDNGRPNNLSAEKNLPPAHVLYNINSTFTDNKDMRTSHPKFFDGKMISDIPIIKDTEVSLIFVNSTAAWHNTVGYYTYPTGQIPTAKTIKRILAFPNVSPIYKSTPADAVGALVCGDEVKLKYWNEKTEEFEDKFPAGVTIGWCLQGNGFKTEDSQDGDLQGGDLVYGSGPRYSTATLNGNMQTQRTVSLRDAETNQIVAIGFEDNVDFDFFDAFFYLRIAEKDAIDEDVIPELPEGEEPTDEENYTAYSGTLTFEDLWPAQGDYDMNDVMIRYTSKVYKSVLTNRVYKIIDEFTPLHRGGYLINGFGYQLHQINNSNISKVTIERPSYVPASQYMPGETEANQSHPTILLFDNMSTFDGRDMSGRKYTVTIQVNDADYKLLNPPYNPFIFVESDKTRGKEVHLVNYPSTDKADISLLGTGNDLSRPEEALYYVSADNMPFALNMPEVSDFPIPEEAVRIDVSYPKFADWVQSNGTKEKDWYKNPKE